MGIFSLENREVSPKSNYYMARNNLKRPSADPLSSETSTKRGKQIRPLANPIPLIINKVAIKTRLYEPVDESKSSFRNKENLTFSMDNHGLFWLGSYQNVQKIPHAPLVDIILNHRGFIYLQIKKGSENVVGLYGLIVKATTTTVDVFDLQSDSEIHCFLSDLYGVISSDVLYQI